MKQKKNLHLIIHVDLTVNDSIVILMKTLGFKGKVIMHNCNRFFYYNFSSGSTEGEGLQQVSRHVVLWCDHLCQVRPSALPLAQCAIFPLTITEAQIIPLFDGFVFGKSRKHYCVSVGKPES